jgi:hypothetical protein
MLGALYGALVAAARKTQVMVTTPSADLLDNAAADPAHLLVVRDDGSGTQIGPIDAAGRQLLADGVLTLPELLRIRDGPGDRYGAGRRAGGRGVSTPYAVIASIVEGHGEGKALRKLLQRLVLHFLPHA